jgi:hypothetical protein
MVTSQNGWPAAPDPSSIGIDQHFSAGGVALPAGVKAGDVATVLGYVCEEFHRNVEPLTAGWCWGYEWRMIRGDSSTLSNHSSGTAVDLNSPHHPQNSSGTFRPAQVDWIRQILRTCGGVVAWGGDWADEMHFEIRGTPDEVAAAAAALGEAMPPPPPEKFSSPPRGGDTVTDDDLEKIAQKVWSYIVGGGGAGATLEEIRVVSRDNAAKLSKLCDPRNGNVDGTG